jgi:hypothetical protein
MTGPSQGGTLDVDSTLIRSAADILEQARAAFAGPAGGALALDAPNPLAAADLGSSAVARAAVVAAGHGLERAIAASRGLGAVTQAVAGRLRATAESFEAAEAGLIGAPR